jgi:hypothetical protein
MEYLTPYARLLDYAGEHEDDEAISWLEDLVRGQAASMPQLTEEGLAYAKAHAAEEITANVALYGRGKWPDGHVDAAIVVINEAAEEYDTSSSASRQHYIDTGQYLKKGEADEA